MYYSNNISEIKFLLANWQNFTLYAIGVDHIYLQIIHDEIERNPHLNLPAQILNSDSVSDSSLSGPYFDVKSLIVQHHGTYLAILRPHVENKGVFYHQPSET